MQKSSTNFIITNPDDLVQKDCIPAGFTQAYAPLLRPQKATISAAPSITPVNMRKMLLNRSSRRASCQQSSAPECRQSARLPLPSQTPEPVSLSDKVPRITVNYSCGTEIEERHAAAPGKNSRCTAGLAEKAGTNGAAAEKKPPVSAYDRFYQRNKPLQYTPAIGQSS